MLILWMHQTAIALTPTEAINSMLGCFEVTFQYEEIKALQPEYILAPPKESTVIEWVTLTDSGEDRISLQHVLVTGPMIRHWRQEWVYEPREIYPYVAPNTWERRYLYPSETSENWAQLVYNVDDAPRYECQSSWESDEHSDFWTCKTLSPIPRRDSKREDYTILERENTHRITKDGWIHEQTNIKFSEMDGVREELVLEKGYNTYIRIDDSFCQEAIDWWPSQETVWDGIILGWSEIRTENERIVLKDKHHGLPLWIRLFWKAKRNSRITDPTEVQQEAKEVIKKYVVSE